MNTHVLESLLDYVDGRKVFPCEICKIFKNSFFNQTPPVAASVIFK